MTKQTRLIFTFLITLLLCTNRVTLTQAQEPQPVARAVMFWMEGCIHCEDVIENLLPPIQEKYGDQLQIMLIELVSSQEVLALYSLAESLGIPQNDVGVPLLIIGDQALIGSHDIPARLPELIDRYLAAGGVDFPDVPALAPLLPPPEAASATEVVSEGELAQTQPPVEDEQRPVTPTHQTDTVTATPRLPTPAPSPLPKSTSAPDAPVFTGQHGFWLAWLTLFFLLGALGFSAVYVIQHKPWQMPAAPATSPGRLDWLFPALALAGLGVAAYLAYVETQAVRAFCGPIGDCNTVQSSPYARLFGWLPIGVLGMFGYALLLTAWGVRRYAPAPWTGLARLGLLGMTLGSATFSAYLTYLEIVVIRAVCLWCLSSAWIMGLLLLLETVRKKVKIKD